MDLIDRRAAIEVIKTKYHPIDFMDDGVIDAFVETIQALPSAQRWIPCSERLPEKRKEVLATTVWRDITIAERWEGNNWFFIEGHGETTTEKLLAWMPLPEPWKGEEDEL